MLSPHADALAVALSVTGLALLDRRRGGSKLFLAAASLLFALSVSAKVTSVAGVAAACLFLWPRERRAAVWLMGMTSFLGVCGFMLLELASNDRFLEYFRAVGSGGLDVRSLFNGPPRLLLAILYSSQRRLVLPLLLAPALFAVWREARERRLSLWSHYFLCTLGATVLIFTSPGTALNHLLELEVAAVLMATTLLTQPIGGPAVIGPAVRGLVAIALLLALSHGALEWREYEEMPTEASSVHQLVEALPKNGQILTEDPTAAILLGQRPVLMDAFAYRLLVERGQVDPRALAERIRRHDFVMLVLICRIEIPGVSLSPHMHFGPVVTDAILDAYHFDRQVGAYFLYQPNMRSEEEFGKGRR